MTTREKVLAGVLGTLVVGGVGGVGGYVGLYKPVADKYRAAEAAKLAADAGLDDLIDLKKKLARLPVAYERSLPSDPVVARSEYEFALSRIIREAKVPRGYTLVPGQPDARPVPELAPKAPAYQRIVFVITMKPVGLDTLTDFLERYHKLGLLHQITKLKVKRPETQTAAARRGSAGDRADLEVELTTEAIILDGVDGRRTLRPVPYAPGALVGAAGLHHLTQSPDLGRVVTAPPPSHGLAAMAREYISLLAKNPFHGPLPPAPKITEPPPPPPPPPLEDISPFIKLNMISRSSDGRFKADIKDTANNLDYEINLTIKDGVATAKIEKFYYLKDRRKRLDSGAVLHISDDSSGTDRTFQVVGIDPNGTDLILTAVPDKGPPAKGGKAALPTAHPIAAVAGGPTAGLSQERVYVWPAGQTLKAVKELAPAEGVKAVERVRAGWRPDRPAAEATVARDAGN